MTWLVPTLAILAFNAAPMLPAADIAHAAGDRFGDLLGTQPKPGGAVPTPPAAGQPPGGDPTGGDTKGGEPGADGKGGTPGQPQAQPNFMSTLLMFGVIFLVFWLFIIRPQSKRQKEHQSMLKGLKKGDRVVTQGGLLGTVADFDDGSGAVLLEIAKGVRVRVVRGNIATMQQKPGGEAGDEKKAEVTKS